MQRKSKKKSDSPDFQDILDGSHEDDSRILFLVGDVEERSVHSVIEGMFRLSEQSAVEPIYLILNTYGGCVDDAIALYDAMQIVTAPIRTVGLGKVMSAGCLLIAAGERGERILGKNSRMMYHGGWEEVTGNVFQHEVAIEELKRTEKLFDQLVAKETGKSLKQVEALYKERYKDQYLTAQEALKFGFVDKLV